MKLTEVRIQNFRSCKDVTVPFTPYTCLVGANGAGKSTILYALNVFFREAQPGGLDFTKLTVEDFHQKNTAEPIRITLTFEDLSPEAQQDFADYYRGGRLVVTMEATYDPATTRVATKQHGERIVMQAFAQYFQKNSAGANVTELRSLYAELREQFPEVPAASTKAAMKEALENYERQHPEQCSLLQSEDEFYGFSRGANRLSKHIQWVYVPAVKDASSEQEESRNTALGQLLARTVRAKTNFDQQVDQIRQRTVNEYQALLAENQAALRELSGTLQRRLTDWAHPDATIRLEWGSDEKSVDIKEPAAKIIAGEDSFEGSIARLGHGLQRSYLLALLQELAGTDAPSGPTLLLGCEEPELYQHPPQARHLFQVFQSLAEADAQVIVTTHSPYFVSGQMFEHVRRVEKDGATKSSVVTYATFDQISELVAKATGERPVKPRGVEAKLHQALRAQLNEMFFARKLVIVEGLEDVAYITAHLQLSGAWDEFRRLGFHIIPADGKDKIIQPLAIANALGIQTFVVCDSDALTYAENPSEKPDPRVARNRPAHIRDNTAIQRLCGIEDPVPLPGAPVVTDRLVMWHSDITSVVKEDIGPHDWNNYQSQADAQLGQPGGLQKNGLHIAIALAKAWQADKRSQRLEDLCQRILKLGVQPEKVKPAGSA
jgi:predicted ATP-dependent endonuclease of OLD family